MNDRNFIDLAMKVAAFVLGCLQGDSVAAVEIEALPTVFTFAAGYKIDVPTPRNVVELGVVKRCDSGWCMDVTRFDSNKLLPRVPTSHIHEMHAPYGGTSCLNGPVSTIVGEGERRIRVALQTETDGFSVATADFRFRWVADAQAPAGYSLMEIASTGGAPMKQAVGFGFSSAGEMQGQITKARLSAFYKGQIYHKTAATGVAGDWVFSPSTIDFRVFDEVKKGSVLIRSLAGDASVVQKYGKSMWVQNTVVLARDAGAIAPLVQEYGHDFNMDGCFNESGHNKLMLPVGDDDVTGLVYIEYTSDYQRGFPMLSVGRYYR